MSTSAAVIYMETLEDYFPLILGVKVLHMHMYCIRICIILTLYALYV